MIGPLPVSPAALAAAVVPCGITKVVAGCVQAPSDDALAVEEPLEIRLAYYRGKELMQQSVSITMRTPGDDAVLALGFLVSEGFLHDPAEVVDVRPCGPAVGAAGLRNVVRVTLARGTAVDIKRLERRFYTTSSCGVCGKTSTDALHVPGMLPLPPAHPVVSAAVVHGLAGSLRKAQAVFGRTGGLHAAGLFNTAGELLDLCEDVGRHNAVDKVVGGAFRAGRLPLHQCLLMVSGRASFELVQKAVLAGVPLLAAVGAPSSLSVELARRYGVTLLGFVRDGRFNIYTGGERIEGAAT